jgi:hypothetical protein
MLSSNNIFSELNSEEYVFVLIIPLILFCVGILSLIILVGLNYFDNKLFSMSLDSTVYSKKETLSIAFLTLGIMILIGVHANFIGLASINVSYDAVKIGLKRVTDNIYNYNNDIDVINSSYNYVKSYNEKFTPCFLPFLSLLGEDSMENLQNLKKSLVSINIYIILCYIILFD